MSRSRPIGSVLCSAKMSGSPFTRLSTSLARRPEPPAPIVTATGWVKRYDFWTTSSRPGGRRQAWYRPERWTLLSCPRAKFDRPRAAEAAKSLDRHVLSHRGQHLADPLRALPRGEPSV